MCFYVPAGLIKSDLRRQNANLLAKAAVSVKARERVFVCFVCLLEICCRGTVVVVVKCGICLFYGDILTCESRKSTGVNNTINDG